MNGGLHSHLLHTYTCRTSCCTCQRQVAYNWHIDTVLVHVSRDFNDAAVGQVCDVVLVDNVKVPSIHAPGLQSFDDIGAMLFTTLIRRDYRRLFLQPVGKVRLKPVATLRTHTQIATRLTIDPL